MNLPELITKLLLIERQLIQDGVEVNTVKVSYKDTTLESELTDDYIEIDDIYVDKKEVQLS